MTAAFRMISAKPNARPNSSLSIGSRPPRRDGRSRLDFRLPGQTHSRIQAAIAQHPCGSSFSITGCERIQSSKFYRGHFIFAGKAAPAYRLAKLIIKFINNLGGTIDGDPAIRGRLKVVFLPDYSVTVAERLIPASDVSNQISTAGYEASGTSNMKFMMNGALTIGTRDGATIEMAEEAGEENFFLFGLTAEQVASQRASYNPQWHYQNDPETHAALDSISSDHFSRNEAGCFGSIVDALLKDGDHYMHLADLQAYLQSDQQLVELYANKVGWSHNAILNVASSGKFSSDRTIGQYAAEIWDAKPCPID